MLPTNIFSLLLPEAHSRALDRFGWTRLRTAWQEPSCQPRPQ